MMHCLERFAESYMLRHIECEDLLTLFLVRQVTLKLLKNIRRVYLLTLSLGLSQEHRDSRKWSLTFPVCARHS